MSRKARETMDALSKNLEVSKAVAVERAIKAFYKKVCAGNDPGAIVVPPSGGGAASPQAVGSPSTEGGTTTTPTCARGEQNVRIMGGEPQSRPLEQDMSLMWKGRQVENVTDLMPAIESCKTREEAAEFMEKYREGTKEADANVGYLSGFYASEDMKRIWDWFGVSHPIFGTTVPTVEEARKHGIRWTRQMPGNRDASGKNDGGGLLGLLDDNGRPGADMRKGKIPVHAAQNELKPWITPSSAFAHQRRLVEKQAEAVARPFPRSGVFLGQRQHVNTLTTLLNQADAAHQLLRLHVGFHGRRYDGPR